LKFLYGAPGPFAALGYLRVSTDEQARDGVSLEAQEARVRAYALAKGLDMAEVLVDNGVSGKSLERPALRSCVMLQPFPDKRVRLESYTFPVSRPRPGTAAG